MASLRFKKDGTPYVDFRAVGRRLRPEFTSVRDAKKFLTLADADPTQAYEMWLENQKFKEPSRDENFLSLKEKMGSFKDNYCSKKARPGDMKRPIDLLFKFLTEKYKMTDLDVRSVTLEDLEAFQTSLIKQKLENSSVNRYLGPIKTFFQRQFKSQQIPVNLAALVENLRVETVQRTAWKDASTPKLIKRLIDTKADPVLIDIAESNQWTPFGPTDYSRLKWSLIDFEIGEINTHRYKGKGRRNWDVPILREYEKKLLAMRKLHLAAGYGKPNDFVYLTKEFKAIDPGWVSKSLERACKAVGIEEVPYSSRHRIITKVAEKTDRDTASKFAGHASLRTTEKHYLVGGNENFRKKIRKAFK